MEDYFSKPHFVGLNVDVLLLPVEQLFFVAWMPLYLQEGRHFSENDMKIITFILFTIGISGFLIGGFIGDWLPKRKGLKFGRRFVGLTGLCCCRLLIFVAAVVPQNMVSVIMPYSC